MTPLLFQVTTAGMGCFSNDANNRTTMMTAYHDLQSMNGPDQASVFSPCSMNGKDTGQSQMNLRPKYNPEDDEESVKVQRGQFSLRSSKF